MCCSNFCSLYFNKYFWWSTNYSEPINFQTYRPYMASFSSCFNYFLLGSTLQTFHKCYSYFILNTIYNVNIFYKGIQKISFVLIGSLEVGFYHTVWFSFCIRYSFIIWRRYYLNYETLQIVGPERLVLAALLSVAHCFD